MLSNFQNTNYLNVVTYCLSFDYSLFWNYLECEICDLKFIKIWNL